MERDDVLNFRLPAASKHALKRAATKDERSMSVMAVRILREWLAAHGYYSEQAEHSGRRSGKRGGR